MINLPMPSQKELGIAICIDTQTNKVQQLWTKIGTKWLEGEVKETGEKLRKPEAIAVLFALYKSAAKKSSGQGKRTHAFVSKIKPEQSHLWDLAIRILGVRHKPKGKYPYYHAWQCFNNDLFLDEGIYAEDEETYANIFFNTWWQVDSPYITPRKNRNEKNDQNVFFYSKEFFRLKGYRNKPGTAEADRKCKLTTREIEAFIQQNRKSTEKLIQKRAKARQPAKSLDETLNNPKTLRLSGPEWIEFAEGLVAERKEVHEIISKLQIKDLVVIKGEPASGKSVLLRNIAYRLANQGNRVRTIELKHGLPDKREILKIDQGYLFIDDAHLNLAYVDEVIQNLCNVKAVISTRDIKQRFGPTFHPKISKYIKGAIEIRACDVADVIIQKFSERSKKISEEIKNELTKNNLWILTWELEAYEKFNRN